MYTYTCHHAKFWQLVKSRWQCMMESQHPSLLTFLEDWKFSSYKVGEKKPKPKFWKSFILCIKSKLCIKHCLKWTYIIWLRSLPQICKVDITIFILQRKKMKLKKTIWLQEKERKEKTSKTCFSLFHPQNLKTCKFKIKLHIATAQCTVYI